MRDLHQVGGILSYFTRHKTVANLLMVVMIAAGVIAFPKMRAQFFPDVMVDTVSVSVAGTGQGPRMLTGDCAGHRARLAGRSGRYGLDGDLDRGARQRALEFEPNWDMDRAADDVQKAIDAISNLPEAADDPQVSRGQWSDRVTDVVITGPVGADQLARFADELILRLFAAGVTQTTVRGVAAAETLIEVPSQSLVSYDVTMAQIADAIAAKQTQTLRAMSRAPRGCAQGHRKRTAEEISGISLRTNADNRC